MCERERGNGRGRREDLDGGMWGAGKLGVLQRKEMMG